MEISTENLWYNQKHLWIHLPEECNVRLGVKTKKPGGRGNKKVTEEELDLLVAENIAKLDPKDRIATIGITETLCEKLGEIDSLELPKVGDDLDIGVRCIHVHLRNIVRYLSSPLTGSVIEINEDLLDEPNRVHLNPYQNWLFKIQIEELEELELLLNSQQYTKLLDGI